MKRNVVKIKNSGIYWSVYENYVRHIDVFSNPPSGLPGTASGRHRHPIFTIPETGERLIIKQSRRGGLISKFNKKTFLDKNRAINEMKLSRYAVENSVPTSLIVAAGYKSVIPGLYNLYVVSRMIENTIPLPEFLRQSRTGDFNSIKAVMKTVIDAILRLHNAGIIHCDLNAHNILIDTGKERHKAYIIDLDKSSLNENLSFSMRMKNICRLERSIRKLGLAEKMLSGTERLSFRESYTQSFSKADAELTG